MIKIKCKICKRFIFFHSVKDGTVSVKCKTCKSITLMECKDDQCNFKVYRNGELEIVDKTFQK